MVLVTPVADATPAACTVTDSTSPEASTPVRRGVFAAAVVAPETVACVVAVVPAPLAAV
ncbi:hypothetical protein AOE01nite_33970 [Acetobacter oeni]|uniref:Uncharacterized protein n=1 Tax=Acetobacter oeni TaxID=304077 RepID=A0A511XQC8_9PROT|nr:hypothetical protein AOE01nite_33970 [Acetobacter oeni]